MSANAAAAFSRATACQESSGIRKAGSRPRANEPAEGVPSASRSSSAIAGASGSGAPPGPPGVPCRASASRHSSAVAWAVVAPEPTSAATTLSRTGPGGRVYSVIAAVDHRPPPPSNDQQSEDQHADPDSQRGPAPPGAGCPLDRLTKMFSGAFDVMLQF